MIMIQPAALTDRCFLFFIFFISAVSPYSVMKDETRSKKMQLQNLQYQAGETP